MAISPMMQQYEDAKATCGDAVLLFRMGDFYELFHDDAKIAARVLGLTLTSRSKGENPIPMAGFPHHQLEGYVSKLIAVGHRAAVCDQVEDPKEAKGIVRREIVRIVTPGTLTDDAMLDPKESNFLAAICFEAKPKAKGLPRAGIAWVELSTGRFYASVVPGNRVADELARISPSECLVSEDCDSTPKHLAEEMSLSKRAGWLFGRKAAVEVLSKHFGTKGLEGFGFDDNDGPAIQAAGAVLDYLQETQKASLEHIQGLTRYRQGDRLEIDESTRRSLEITRTIREGRRDGSLLAVLDRTVSAMGSRLLADWLANPLTDISAINSRLDAVGELLRDSAVCDALREQLKGVYDLQRLLARVTTGRASPRDLSFISRTFGKLPVLKEKLAGCSSSLLNGLDAAIDLVPDLRAQLEVALSDDCPLVAKDGGFIRDGYSQQLDEMRELSTGGREWIARYQADAVETSGIPSLKVGYNKVFGYYIEVTHTHRDKVPEHFIRKQTLKNAERYITPELKEYEEKVLSADEKASELEYELFLQLRTSVQEASNRLQATADVLAQLDVLASLAELARQRSYARPELVDDVTLDIVDGRHPVLDITEPEGTFVPNDTQAGEEGIILLITGPNMAGKSTYIRQVALLTLMAQMGSYVPAKKAVIGVADRIFARVGASDELSRGQSTFMVEMTDTARILNTATSRSLVILDEIGRGTSTYDGVSLAWSVVEHLHDSIGCRTLFATHYHELTDLAGSLKLVRNLNVAVQEWDDNVVFLHKIVPGSADKSYGIHVARLAGVPKEVNERAKQILAQLESEHLDEQGQPRIAKRGKERPRGDIQLSLFGPTEHPLLEVIRAITLDETTPIEALQLIQRWQEELS